METFGQATRRMRGSVSLRELARRAYLDPGHLSKIENDVRPPTRAVAEALDTALNAGGALIDLAATIREQRGSERSGRRSDQAETATVLGPDEDDRLRRVADNPRRLDLKTITSLALVLREQRRLEDLVGSASLIDPAVAQLGLVEGLVIAANGRLRDGMVEMASQWAQFAGWLHTAGGRWTVAKSWFGKALKWATEIDDREMIATVLSYQGYIAWLRGQTAQAIGLSRAARRRRRAYPGQLAYDAFQEARGHAAAGDTRCALNTLSEANDLAEAAAVYQADTPPWQYYRQPWFFSLERGLALRYLAERLPDRADLAVEHLSKGLTDIPNEMGDAEWAAEYRCHLAAALQQVGQPGQAKRQAEQARRAALATGSPRLLSLIDKLVPPRDR